MNRSRTTVAALVLLGVAGSAAEAQDDADAPYRPLFTEEMILGAAPEQRERMRAAEAINRQSYERRQEAAKKAAAAPAPAPPPRARPRRSKIYKWVDDKGRTHFGDAPAGKGAEEITIKAPAPASPSTSGDRSPGSTDND